MLWLGVFAIVVLFVGLAIRGWLHPLVPILVIGASSVCVWIMIVRTAALPRAMTPTGQNIEAYKTPLAFSPRAAWFAELNAIVRVSLPELKPIVVLPLSTEQSPLTSVAWNGHELLVLWFSEVKKGGLDTKKSYAIAGDEGWLVPPRPLPHEGIVSSGYWDPLARAFVIVSNGHATGTEAAYRTNTFTFIDAQGKEVRTVVNVGPDILSATTAFCASEGDIVATTGTSICRTKSPIETTSSWTCEQDRKTATLLPMCPNQLSAFGRPETWIGAGGRTKDLALPAPLASRGFTFVLGAGLTLRGAEVEPRDLRDAPDHSRLLRLDDGYVLVRHLTEEQSRALGHTSEYQSLLERYDAQGRLVAQNGVLGVQTYSATLLPSNGEIALLTDSLDQAARFDLKTMKRIDNPGVVTALRDRLERWGGPSALFRGLVQLTLALGPLTPLLLMAWLVAKFRSSERSVVWLARGASVLAVLGVVALAMTLTRYYYL